MKPQGALQCSIDWLLVDVCVYNGKIYTQGQQWDDGCTYHCVCLDSTTGHYQCTER